MFLYSKSPVWWGGQEDDCLSADLYRKDATSSATWQIP